MQNNILCRANKVYDQVKISPYDIKQEKAILYSCTSSNNS